MGQGWKRCIYAIVIPVVLSALTAAWLENWTLPQMNAVRDLSSSFGIKGKYVNQDFSRNGKVVSQGILADAIQNLNPDKQTLKVGIFDKIISLPFCTTCIVSFSASSHLLKAPYTLRDAVKAPDQFKIIINDSSWIRVNLQKNDSDLWLGRYDPKTFPSLVSVVLYRTPYPDQGCWRDPNQQDGDLCQSLLQAGEDDRADRDVAGYVLLPNDRRFDRGDKYVSKTSVERSIQGIPLFFECTKWSDFICQIGAYGPGGGGFLIKRDLSLLISFSAMQFPETEWLALHRRTVSVIQSMFDKDL